MVIGFISIFPTFDVKLRRRHRKNSKINARLLKPYNNTCHWTRNLTINLNFWSKFLFRPRILVKIDFLLICVGYMSHMTSMEFCKRLKSGDLSQRYEDEVINIDHPDRDAMMSVMNTICGNLELECAYASYFYSEWNYYDPGK